MGAKRSMLANGLASIITSQISQTERFVDLFSGTGSVSWFVAENFPIPVLANDLQVYASVLATSVIGRNESVEVARLASNWVQQACADRDQTSAWELAREADELPDQPARVFAARTLCARNLSPGPIWRAYGGHYFSPSQALTIDHLLGALPDAEPNSSVALASLIVAASRCAAAPGHTAQPFQPTPTALPHLVEAWSKDPIDQCMKALNDIAPRRALVPGQSLVCDAFQVSTLLTPNDLVFLDPPYSSVQYSRFYHVLETIARRNVGRLDGIGRYPPLRERPQSSFSLKSRSQEAFIDLIKHIALASARVILTYPAGESSNGMSGRFVRSIAEKWFKIEDSVVSGKFSTLGGNNQLRASRAASEELVLVLSPK